MVATFSGVSANAGYSQTAFPGQTVTLAGSAIPAAGASFSWLPSGGNPAPVTLSDPAAASPSFTAPAANGTYYFNLSVNGGAAQASTAVYVSNSNPSAARFLCVGCHQNSNIGPGVYQLWSSSRHSRFSQNSCQACHVGDANGAHPGTLISGSVNETTFTYVSSGAVFCLNCHNPAIVASYNGSLHPANSVTCGSCHTSGVHDTDFNPTACDGCHRDGSGNVPLHPLAIGTSSCVSCHDPHSTMAMAGAPGSHFNNLTGAGYPASYMTSRSNCSNCHDGTPANQLIRKQWDVAGHGATTEPPWASQDFKTKPGCVRCHTTTGFIAYSTGRVTAAWGVASDKTKEVLTCIGCHSDISAGTVRSVTPARPFADDSYQNRNVGASNVCMDCHSGTNNGNSIQLLVGTADFSNQPFVAPHYLAAGGTLHAVSGYHFPGGSYAFYSSNTHRGIGIANNNGTGSAGPCVGCHMSASQDHLFKTVSADSSGNISAITATVCVNCHAGSLGVAQLNADKTLFVNALTVLKAQLAARGFVPSPGYPFFSNTNWGAGQDGANVMGAAFNYVLMASEPGAYTHNSRYARQLVLDSIDYLDNGQLDNSVTTLAVPTLLASGAISQAVADSFTSYQAKKDQCTVCHGGTAASAAPMATNAHPAHLSGPYGPGLYLGSSLSYCQACHPFGPATHMNGSVDLASGAGSACQGCHAGAPPAWNATARLDCTGCHAALPAVLPNGVAAPYKASFASSGHGQYPASNGCTICHDPNSSHISGTLGSYTRLLLPNDNNLCASCHSNAALVRPAFLNLSSHVTKDGRTLGCRECHDPHGTGNLSMIRQTINGTTIVFTDNVNGLVDPVGNRGLCQVCHTLTSHYLAGVPETGHYASGCLNCHSHNSPGGAFRPVGGACDSCHGYPPVPKNTGSNFGTANNYANARYEDYSGGGGRAPGDAAHLPLRRRLRGVGQLHDLPQRWPDRIDPLPQDGDSGGEPHRQRDRPGRPGAALRRRVHRLHRRQARQPACPQHDRQLLQYKLPHGPVAALEHGTLAGCCPPIHKEAQKMDNCKRFTALRLAALLLALGALLAFAQAAQAAPQYNLSCIACHQMPPLDSATAKKNPYTGAVPGNHQGHAAAQVASCVVCHGPGVTSYSTTHRSKTIALSDALGYSRKAVGGFLNQTSVPPSPLGSCSSVACHSDGKGHLAATPAWGSAPFAAPADCARCHGVAPATGNHPITGSKHAAYFGTGTGSCVKCHADHTVEAKPFGHASSAGHRAIGVQFAGGGSFAGTTCATLYCHSNGKGTFSTPTWGATLDCTGCHGSATLPGPAPLSGKHANHLNNAALLGTNYGCIECHSATVSSNTAIADFTKHADGSVEVAGAHVGSETAGSTCATSYCHSDGKGTQKSVTWVQTQTLDCKGCHGSDAAPAFASLAGEPNYANGGSGAIRANNHQVHVSGAADCQNCHASTTATGLAILAGAPHTNGSIDVVAGNGKSFTVAGKTCSNVSCHSGNGIIASVAPATWGASLGCNGCHGDASSLATNAHAKHVQGKGYACATCHAATATGSTVILNPALHGDGIVEVAGASITGYTAATKSCATAACHGGSTPVWNNLATGGCGSCHAALSTTGGVIATNGHNAHFNAAYGPALAASTANSCAVCHLYTTDTAATHDNGSVDLAAGFAKVGTCTGCHAQSTNWTGGRVSCESCHSTAGGPLSVIGGLTAQDKTLSATAGHGKAGIGQACTACHDNGSAHISSALGTTTRLLPGLTGAANTECNYCHTNPAVVTPAHLNMQVHVGSGATCAACHDPHGTTNANEVRTSLNATTVAFGGTDFVNAQGTGVCQACHSATAYYKKGVAETNHPATGCLTCHAHNASSGTAFEPNRACDSCHGYPPAPRKVTTAVAFGVQGNWSSARFEDYSGGGAHLVAGHIPKNARVSDGWLNCIPCHAGGAAAHAKIIPARSHVENVTVKVDPQYRFSNDVLISYTSAKMVSGGINKTGSCFNVSCHMAQTPKWSIER